MEIEYFLDEGDVLELMQYRMNQIPKRRHPMQIRRVIYLIGILLLAVGITLILGNWLVSIPLVLFGVIFFFIYPSIFKLLLIRRVHIKYLVPEQRDSLSNRTLRVTDEGMVEKSSLGEIKFNWQVVDIRKTSTYAIIFIQGIPSMVIPEKKVTSGDFDRFIEMFIEYKIKSSPGEI